MGFIKICKSYLKSGCEVIGSKLRTCIDFFYPPFSRYMDIQFYRYGVVGVSNLVFDWVLYFAIYNFVLQKQMLSLGFITLSSHVAGLAIKFPIVLLSGFLLQKFVTFTTSELRGRIQLFRYLVVFFVNVVLNYVGLKFFVDMLGFYPTPSNMIVSSLTIVVSYFAQKHYTFKVSIVNSY